MNKEYLKYRISFDDCNCAHKFANILQKLHKMRVVIHVRKSKNVIVKLPFEDKLQRDLAQLNLVALFQDLKLN